MKQRIITGIILVAVLMPALLAGGLPFKAVVIFFVAIGSYEVYDIKRKKWPFLLFSLMVLCIYMIGMSDVKYLVPLLILTLIFLFVMTIFFEWFDLMDVTYLFTMILLMSMAVISILTIVKYGTLVIVFVAAATYATDTGAYFFGYYFGKHKLNERISPKKTIEGSLGGWLMGAVISLIYAYFFVKTLPFNFLIIACLTLPVIGQIGDLAFSAIKRYFKIKDFGNLFPAHGGVLDRIDSLIFNLLFFYVLLIFFH